MKLERLVKGTEKTNFFVCFTKRRFFLERDRWAFGEHTESEGGRRKRREMTKQSGTKNEGRFLFAKLLNFKQNPAPHHRPIKKILCGLTNSNRLFWFFPSSFPVLFFSFIQCFFFPKVATGWLPCKRRWRPSQFVTISWDHFTESTSTCTAAEMHIYSLQSAHTEQFPVVNLLDGQYYEVTYKGTFAMFWSDKFKAISRRTECVDLVTWEVQTKI